VFEQSGCYESSSGCQNNVPIGTTMPTGVERHSHLAFCGTFLGPRTFGVRGNEITDGLAREGSVHQFVGLEPASGVSKKNSRRKSKVWLDNQHTAVKQGLNITERQAQNLISGPGPTVKTRPLSFNTIQYRLFTGLLTGRDTLRTHLYIMGVIDSPLCRRCEAEEESSVHFLYECEALATLKHTYMGFFFLDPKEVRSQSLGTI